MSNKKMRTLGNSDLQIAPIVFGGNVFGWTADEKKSFDVLDAFVDAGFNCVDTADIYSSWVPGNEGGESERILGKWMAARKNRDRMVIATKVGMEFKGEKGLKADYIARAIDGSLKRLQTDYVDLYQAHQDDASTSLEETLKAFEKIKNDGKVKVVGASNYSGARLQEAVKTAQANNLSGYRTFQPCYNLYDRQEFESQAEGLCLEHKISVITYYSLASGFLTGKYRSEKDFGKSPRGQGMQEKLKSERGPKILKALDEISEELRATPAQVSLAWLLHRPSVTAPIVSATSVEQVKDIAHAVELTLSKDQLSKLDQASKW